MKAALIHYAKGLSRQLVAKGIPQAFEFCGVCGAALAAKPEPVGAGRA